MAAENQETSNGWPLGLQIVSMKIRLQQSLQSSTPAVELEPHSSNLSSPSFSSVSSSNLDTQSSASFFQDNSVSLGKLIGFGQHERGSVRCFQNTIPAAEESNWQPVAGSGAGDCEDVSSGDLCRLGICIQVMAGSLVKITRSRSKSK
ncbi:hypothetical protein V6N13_062967 [Hibiscus sabdariffa]|uniref:Uncharacterized protein n=2 Tax=Hibiscus sabdariffa TaxID=183260 RepID=A0ABR1ZWX0_9ROSI